ncbi:MAG: hypothetical protein J6X39_05940 [Bacteroidales bacterium]|nr:hypothetical protein [Bacteroidales bacterium]
MEENFDALEVIARTRGKVDMDSNPTGDPIFVLWGSLTAFFYILEFVFMRLGFSWAIWLWAGVPVVGLPLMAVILRRSHLRDHRRTRGSKLVLDYWIFAACAIGLGGFIFGFFDIYEVVENPMICLLIGIGCFLTGEVMRFRPKIICGLIGAAIGIGSFLLQDGLWVWQPMVVALAAIVSLLLPGLLFNKSVKNGI